MKALPKFTVVIPTRERADVLPAALRTVVAQDYENLEILVSDNFSEDETADVVHAFNDPRIRYINTGRRLSMSHNWEFALSHVDDGWVTILGDDDGLIPGALTKVIELAQDNGASAVRSSVCKYKWPSANDKGGRLNIPMSTGVEVRRSEVWLRRALDGKASYAELPMLYTGGFANMCVMTTIKDKMGSFYSSCVPDVYSGVSIVSVIPKYLYSHAPLAIAGVSRHSIGTSHFSRPPSAAEITPAQRFISEGNIPFHPDIPVCRDGIIPRSPQITLLESYLQSLPLRSEIPTDFYAKQLDIVTSAHAKRDEDMEIWLRDFAEMHHLDIKKSLRRGSWYRLMGAFMGAPARTLRRWKTAKLRSGNYDISDVYFASITAAAYLRASQADQSC